MPLALGVFGTFGTEAANAAVTVADPVLAIGTKLGPPDTAWENRDLLDPTRQTFIQIDFEPKNASWNFPAEHVLVGDAAGVLRQLIDDVSSQSSGRRTAGEARVAGLRREHGYFDAPEYAADDAPLLPQPGYRRTGAHAAARRDRDMRRRRKPHPNDAFLPDQAGRRFPAGGGLRPNGLRHPRRTGRQAGASRSPGRGGMRRRWLCQDNERADDRARTGIPIIVIIFNNNSLGWVYHGSGSFAAEFKDFNHGAIARAMGYE